MLVRSRRTDHTCVYERSVIASVKGCVMTGRMNWSRIDSRARMQRQGVEDVKGKTPLGGQPPKIRRRLSKPELREQAAAAFLAWRAGQTSKDK